MVLSDGGVLPPLPVLTHLMDNEYKIYEREVNNAEGKCLKVPLYQRQQQHVLLGGYCHKSACRWQLCIRMVTGSTCSTSLSLSVLIGAGRLC